MRDHIGIDEPQDFADRFLGCEIVGPMPTRSIKNGPPAYMKPPPGVPTLTDLPPNLALAFQRAFDQDGVTKGRPSAVGWLKLLEAARADLTTCRSNPAHQYFRQASEYPCCPMEATFPGLLLFNAPMSGAVFTRNDIRSLSAALNAIADPGPAPDIFQSIINPTHLAPSPNAIQTRSQCLRRYLVLGAGAGGGLLLLLYSMPLLGVLAIIGARYVFKQLPDNTSALETAKNTAEAAWNTACQDWQAKTGNQSYLKIRSDGLNAIKELAELPNLEKQRIQELNHKRHELQLVAFLQKYRIDRAKIRNVGSGQTAAARLLWN